MAEAAGHAERGAIDRLTAAPVSIAIAALALLWAAYLGSAVALGGLSALADPAGAASLHPALFFNAVISIVLGFTVWVSLWDPGLTGRDLDALRPILTCAPAEYARLRDAVCARPLRSGWSALLGGLIGAGLHVLGRLAALEQGFDPWGAFHSTWNLILLTLLFAAMGQRTLGSISIARIFSDLGRHRTQVRLLCPDALRPFARCGLRLAAYWFVGSALASLLFIEAGSAILVAMVLIVTIGLAVVSLLMPCRGVHERIRALKASELASARQAIERGGDALLGRRGDSADEPPDRERASATLASLIAYEARIESVREWPFDTPTLGRFMLFLLIPLGSWLGGAMVERMVDAALG